MKTNLARQYTTIDHLHTETLSMVMLNLSCALTKLQPGSPVIPKIEQCMLTVLATLEANGALLGEMASTPFITELDRPGEETPCASSP